MRVVLAGDYPPDSKAASHGVESVGVYLSRALALYSDLTLDIVTLDRLGTVKRTARSGNITVHYLPAARMRSYFYTLLNIRQIQACISRLRPDLIHVQVAGEYAEAAVRTGLPWVLTLHGIRHLEVDRWSGFLNKVYRGWFVKREERRAIKRARHIISISPFIESTLGKQIRGKIYTIENPIDDAFFKVPINLESGRLLMVGRLTPSKNVLALLHAFVKLHQRMPETSLRLAGGRECTNEPTDYERRLKQFVNDKGLSEVVTFLGELNKPALLKELSNCSVFVLSSLIETAPMVIMEAMAAGKTVVSTDVGGIRHLVEQNQTGLLVPSGDEQSLVDALDEVLRDPQRLRIMGCRAREVAKHRFHAKAVAAQTREVYYQVLDRSRPLD